MPFLPMASFQVVAYGCGAACFVLILALNLKPLLSLAKFALTLAGKLMKRG